MRLPTMMYIDQWGYMAMLHKKVSRSTSTSSNVSSGENRRVDNSVALSQRHPQDTMICVFDPRHSMNLYRADWIVIRSLGRSLKQLWKRRENW
jgi:hypothetical protein